MARKEIKLFKQNESDDFHDICFGDTGDFLNEDSYDTDIEMSLFTDARADSSQIEAPQLRRGWLGDEFSTLVDFKLGSRLWLLSQARNTVETLDDAVSFVQDSIKWMTRKKYVTRVNVSGTRSLGTGELTITTDIFFENNEVKKFTFDLFKLSKYAGNIDLAECAESDSDFITSEDDDDLITESGEPIISE